MRIPVEVPQRKIENDPAGKRPARRRNAKSGSVGAKFIYNKREGDNPQNTDPQVMENTHLEKEPEFSPEEMKAIKDTAHFIQEHRMSNDPERQKYWAKKYGLDENIFSEKNIKAILSGRGEWNDASEKFMQDWDWETAKKAFMNMKKADEQASKPKMEDAVRRKAKENQGQINRKTAEDKRIEDLEDNQLKRNMEFDAEQEPPAYGYKQGDEALAFSKGWKEKKYENVKPVEISSEKQKIELDPNNPVHVELIQAIADFEAKQAQIAEMRAKKGGRWASLRKTLGFEEKNIDTDPEVMVLEEKGKGLYRDLMAKGIHLYKGDKPQLEIFLRQFDEFESFRNVRNQELDKKGEVAGFPENILAGLHTLTKKWSELNWKQKIAISVGGGLLVAGGAMALGAGTFGAATLGLGYRWGFRAFGAAAAGVGRNVMLDRQMMTEMESEAEARLKERMDNIEKYENDLDQGIEEMLNKSGISNIRKDFEQRRTANELRSLKFARNTFIISSIIGESLREVSQATGINIGSILSKIGEKTGISLAGMKESVGNFLSVSQANAEGGGMTGG
ncbi:MAG: hypothetical protein NT093_05030, partial [Candidatus Moranbacteria bacterium]|nr:hypothetical protein [Candidatus Moranbacteria bacterium]